MNPRLQLRVQRYGWDKAANVYEGSWGRQVAPSQEVLLQRASLQRGEHVLEIAAGTGLITFPTAHAVGPDGHVVATDLSSEMVDIVAARAEEREMSWVTSRRMGAEALDFDDGIFDVVLCGLGLMYVPDPRKAIAEAARVLRPGGRLVVAVWGERRKCGWAEIFPIVDRRVASDVCPLFFQLGGGRALEMLYEGAGFSTAMTDRIAVDLEYGSSEEALEAAFAGGPVALAYDRFDEETRNEAHVEYLQSIEPFRNGRGYRIPGEFVIVSGTK